MSASTKPDQSPTVRASAQAAIERAWAAAAAAGTLPAGPDVVDIAVEVERPAKPEHGDLATSLPLKLARPLRMAPAAIAEALAGALTADIDRGRDIGGTGAEDSASPWRR